MECDWLIIGGGIHGVHLSARLIAEAGISPEQLRIVDPGAQLLERWRACTATTGMKHLRSPAVHHLALSPWSLKRFAGKSKRRNRGLFAAPYERPALPLFNEHCDQVICEYGLDERHIQARAEVCIVSCDGVHVTLSTGEEVVAQHVVLALGVSEQPHWPAWAPRNDPRVQHIFERGFQGFPTTHERVVVVGGGISAGQVALRLHNAGHKVDVVARHDIRAHQFDSDPGWLGPKRMRNFTAQGDADLRRAMITEARHRGSVSPDVKRGLRRAIRHGDLAWQEAEIESFTCDEGGPTLHLSNGVELRPDRILLATGFSSARPGGELVDRLVEQASLPCASCGYPIVDRSLRWHPRIYVSGPLAELELGPTSRNISGARKAGDRVVRSVLSARKVQRVQQQVTDFESLAWRDVPSDLDQVG